jgi:hypothetical protein
MEKEHVCCEAETQINSEYLPKQYSPTGLCSVDEVRFLWGENEFWSIV